ncbi:unnamed protein product [Sphenostylis stenocarpa]|uniref:Uncharacterized protein n=1 Tax=Sphenostylis stenocarpa TaxID=92480 RepID=A0AA86SJ65_9FABA|nr:unnamed protein product [Sphenostylis stenocarpa]
MSYGKSIKSPADCHDEKLYVFGLFDVTTLATEHLKSLVKVTSNCYYTGRKEFLWVVLYTEERVPSLCSIVHDDVMHANMQCVTPEARSRLLK